MKTSKIELLELLIESLKNSDETSLQEIAIGMGLLCESCYGSGYLEVTQEDDCQYIEACDTCDHFGLIGNSNDEQARSVATDDGYKLDPQGKILGDPNETP